MVFNYSLLINTRPATLYVLHGKYVFFFSFWHAGTGTVYIYNKNNSCTVMCYCHEIQINEMTNYFFASLHNISLYLCK